MQHSTFSHLLVQGMIVAEMWMDHMARVLGKPVEALRELNMYQEGDRTHFGQLLNSSQA